MEEYSLSEVLTNKLLKSNRETRASLYPPKWNSHSTLCLMKKKKNVYTALNEAICQEVFTWQIIFVACYSRLTF